MKKKKKRFAPLRAFLKTILILIIVGILAVAAALYFDVLGLKSIQTGTLPYTDEELYVATGSTLTEDVINILLIGVDHRDYEPTTRSDTIIVLSYDKTTAHTSFISFMRDTCVYIPDAGYYDKINAAYAYGDEATLIKTLNYNFDLNIKHYVTVDFSAMEQVVDALGGVEIEILEEEIDEINKCLREQAKLLGGEEAYIESSGVQTLTGRQALGYCRVRNVGNSDWDRTSRQRKLLGAIAREVTTDLNVLKIIKLVREVLPLTQTNMDSDLIIELGKSFLSNRETFFVEDFRIPFDDYVVDAYGFGGSYLYPDTLEDNVIKLHQNIYGIDTYEPSERVLAISNEIYWMY